MKAAIISRAGEIPVYGDINAPQPVEGESRVTVTAAALSHLVKSRAAGTHYSASGQFPLVVGIDGVGRRDDGQRVYFVLPKAPFGSMAGQTVVRTTQCIPLPDDLDDVTAAAIANPGMSSWAAFKERAKLKRGETVLINGAAGSAGRLAVQIAKHFGASKVIATGRNADALKSLAELGADVTIPLVDDLEAMEDAFKQQFAEGVDVVLDYLWGQSAERLLIAAAKLGQDAVPIRFVQIGALSAPDITLPGAVLRSSAIELMGSGIGSIALDRLFDAVRELLHAVVPIGLRIATTPVPLSDVERAWPNDDSRRRTVFIMDGEAA